MIPKILDKISNYANKQKIVIHKGSDGRLNSTKDEKGLIKLLKKKYHINEGKKRAWYDFSVTDKGIFYPVNIKSTTEKKNDNLSCKLGIYYALTGIEPTFANESGWDKYFKMLEKDLKKNSRDYYFMVLNKTTRKTRMCSLKGLAEVVTTGNNLPFQCNFSKNMKEKKRSYEDAKEFLIEEFKKSIIKTRDKYDAFKGAFPDRL